MLRSSTRIGVGLAASLATVAVETVTCWYLLDHRLPDVVMVYLLGIVLLAVRLGYSASLPATVLSVAAVDFFFTVPYFSFGVADKRFFLTFVLMTVVATVISAQTERMRRREQRTGTLYAMTRELAAAGSPDEVAVVARRHLREVFDVSAAILVLEGADVLRPLAPESAAPPPDGELLRRARRMLAQRPSADGLDGLGLHEAEPVVVLRGSAGARGVIVMRHGARSTFRARTNRDLVLLFVSQIATALERARLADETQRAQLAIKTERLRNALLSSVSHDLRTPLGVIKGAATALLDGGDAVPPERVRENLSTISAEATRLNRLIRNLLDVTALEAGTVRVRKEWQLLEEVIGVAQNRLEDQLEGRRVQVRIDPEAALAPFDATLLEQVFVNLIENATKYAPPSSPIELDVAIAADAVQVTVSDRGPGVPEGREELVFEKFQRAAESASGIGLGLTVCRGIVTAHGGEIRCSNRSGGGATFRFTLPLDQERPRLDELPEAADEP
jgi:two-component system sensor histidine kinase KdpD